MVRKQILESENMSNVHILGQENLPEVKIRDRNKVLAVTVFGCHLKFELLHHVFFLINKTNL